MRSSREQVSVYARVGVVDSSKLLTKLHPHQFGNLCAVRGTEVKCPTSRKGRKQWGQVCILSHWSPRAEHAYAVRRANVDFAAGDGGGDVFVASAEMVGSIGGLVA